ncbi:Bug family tripartite tricarboxylate transporter substrate binding protein [Roseomonas xinghualingensis]|uniref:Bug family tripartite tricarboxylate transporter substrate binding protein n=1 Tax=Roseomonas xinghualingensis TaxID=2986475 RepID=UPI0021F11430|nr:tripartite tricarboxylate transporter substrate binding protein [Roseomonas sp. SXEYE001]MCV4207986.1 tripartite tricarboxylate transporter substrate binding protein [Roseomonas sp. SXEYE001]
MNPKDAIRPGRRALLAAALAAPAAAQAQVQGFPSKPIALIVPFPPGGTTDIAMRALAEAASRHLPHPIIIENKPGAANTLGAAQVARARPDGYLLTQFPASAIRVQILQKLSYDPVKDFTPIICVTGYPFVVAAKAGRFPGGWKGFVEEARRNPGRMSYGSTGANGTPHVTMAQLMQREKLELTHVPFRGDADGAQALLGGHIQLMAGSTSLGGLVDGGQAEFMNVWTAERLGRWSNVPTLSELGYDMVVTTPFGLVAPAGLDPAITRILHDAFQKAMKDPQFVAMLDRYNMVSEYRDSATYASFLQEMVKQEEDLIRRLGLQSG